MLFIWLAYVKVLKTVKQRESIPSLKELSSSSSAFFSFSNLWVTRVLISLWLLHIALKSGCGYTVEQIIWCIFITWLDQRLSDTSLRLLDSATTFGVNVPSSIHLFWNTLWFVTAFGNFSFLNVIHSDYYNTWSYRKHRTQAQIFCTVTFNRTQIQINSKARV